MTRWSGFCNARHSNPPGSEIVEAEDGAAALEAFAVTTPDIHELHTPLNAVIGFNELIAQQTLGPIAPPRYIEFAHSIRSAGQRALAVFLDVMMMVELRAERFELHLESIDLCEAVKAAVAEFLGSEPGTGRAVDVATDVDRLALRADPQVVKQMLLKLLSNTAKFSAAGTPIQLSVASAGDGSFQVSVADAGNRHDRRTGSIGGSPLWPDRQRARPSLHGLGVGPSIVSKPIERHGGV